MCSSEPATASKFDCIGLTSMEYARSINNYKVLTETDYNVKELQL